MKENRIKRIDGVDESIVHQIVRKIKDNRISTTEIADCLNKSGDLPNVKSISEGNFRVGPIHLIYGWQESNWNLHIMADDVVHGEIVIVEMFDFANRAAFGDLVSKFLTLYRGAEAIVVNGLLRDRGRILRERYPIWCKGFTPIGSFKTKMTYELPNEVLDNWKSKYENGIAVCDDGGVVIIPEKEVNEEFLNKLDFIELQEDIWYYCMNTKKWSTYDIVCLTKYKDDTSLLPPELREAFENFTKE